MSEVRALDTSRGKAGASGTQDKPGQVNTSVGLLFFRTLRSQCGSRWSVLGCLRWIRSIFRKQTALVCWCYLITTVPLARRLPDTSRGRIRALELGHLGVGFEQQVFQIQWKGWILAAHRRRRNGRSNRTVRNGKVRTGQGGWGRYFWTARRRSQCQTVSFCCSAAKAAA